MGCVAVTSGHGTLPRAGRRRLVFAEDLARMRMLVDELMAMRVRLTADGNEQYGAWRDGSHDDLALAMALACWRAKGDERRVGECGDGRVV